MKKYYIIAGVAVAAVVVAAFIIRSTSPQLAGDFPGGALPTNLFTGSDAAGYVYPVGSLALGAPNGLYTGGLNANNEITALYTATTSYPVGTSTITLGGYQNTTSTTSTTIGVPSAGFSVGDACEVTYTATPTSTAFGADGFITAVGNGTATATVTLWNGNSSAVTFTGSTSTPPVLKATCFHTGV